MNLKEVKNILKNSKYLSKTKIEDEVEINGTISLWNRNDVDIIIEFDDENDINFSEDTLKLIEDKLDWIDKNKKLICKTFIEDEGMFYGLNDEIEKQLSKKEKAKIDDLEFSAPLTEDEFSNSLYIAYINFYIENEDDISCNFATPSSSDFSSDTSSITFPDKYSSLVPSAKIKTEPNKNIISTKNFFINFTLL